MIEYWSNLFISFAFVNHLFEYNNYENPVKKYIDDSFHVSTDFRVHKYYNIFVKSSMGITSDDIMGFYEAITYEMP